MLSSRPRIVYIHAQDTEHSGGISYNCSNCSNIFSKLDKNLQTSKYNFAQEQR